MLLLTDARANFPPSGSDYGVLMVELLFYTIAFVLWAQVMSALWKAPMSYFKSWWNAMDFLNYNFFMAVVVLRLYVLWLLNDLNFDPPSSLLALFPPTNPPARDKKCE